MGMLLKPETVYETENPLPDWQPGKERGLSVTETLKDFKIDGLHREGRDDQNRDR